MLIDILFHGRNCMHSAFTNDLLYYFLRLSVNSGIFTDVTMELQVRFVHNFGVNGCKYFNTVFK